MKITNKKESVNTMPDGVWESSRPTKNKDNDKNSAFTVSTDLQGNGYPIKKQNQ